MVNRKDVPVTQQMDLLKAEIAGKRKAATSDLPNNARPNKYMRKGELDKLREEQERLEKAARVIQHQDAPVRSAVRAVPCIKTIG